MCCCQRRWTAVKPTRRIVYWLCCPACVACHQAIALAPASSGWRALHEKPHHLGGLYLKTPRCCGSPGRQTYPCSHTKSTFDCVGSGLARRSCFHAQRAGKASVPTVFSCDIQYLACWQRMVHRRRWTLGRLRQPMRPPPLAPDQHPETNPETCARCRRPATPCSP